MKTVILGGGPYDGKVVNLPTDSNPDHFWYESSRDPHVDGPRRDSMRISGACYKRVSDGVYEYDPTGGPNDETEHMPSGF